MYSYDYFKNNKWYDLTYIHINHNNQKSLFCHVNVAHHFKYIFFKKFGSLILL